MESLYQPSSSATKGQSRPADAKRPLQPRQSQVYPAGWPSLIAREPSRRESRLSNSSTRYADDCTPDPTSPTSMYAEYGSAREDTFVQTSTPLTARKVQTSTPLTAHKAPSLKIPDNRLSWIIPSDNSSQLQTSPYPPGPRWQDDDTLHYSIPLKPSAPGSKGSEWPSSYTSSFDASGKDGSTTITNSRVNKPGRDSRRSSDSSGEKVSVTVSDSRVFQPAGDGRIASRRALNDPTFTSSAASPSRRMVSSSRQGIPYSPSRLTSPGQETCDNSESVQFHTLKTFTSDPTPWSRRDPAHRRLVTPKTIGQMYSGITPQRSEYSPSRLTSPGQETFDNSKSVQFHTLKTFTSDPGPWSRRDPAHRRLVTPKTIGQMYSDITPQRNDRHLALIRTPPLDTPVSPSTLVPQPDGGRRKLSFHYSSLPDQTPGTPASRDDLVEPKRWDTDFSGEHQRRKLSVRSQSELPDTTLWSELTTTPASPQKERTLPPDTPVTPSTLLAQPDGVRRKLSFHSSYSDRTLPSRDDTAEPKLWDKDLTQQHQSRMLSVRSQSELSDIPSDSSIMGYYSFRRELQITPSPASPSQKECTYSDMRRPRQSICSNLAARFESASPDSTASFLETHQSPKMTHKNAPTKTIENVKNLTVSTFSTFIKNQELAVVMFHNSTTDKPGAVGAWTTHSLKAPRGVKPAFASVDCATEAELCAKEAITANPLFKLYSGGYLVNSVKDFGQLNYN